MIGVRNATSFKHPSCPTSAHHPAPNVFVRRGAGAELWRRPRLPHPRAQRPRVGPGCPFSNHTILPPPPPSKPQANQVGLPSRAPASDATQWKAVMSRDLTSVTPAASVTKYSVESPSICEVLWPVDHGWPRWRCWGLPTPNRIFFSFLLS